MVVRSAKEVTWWWVAHHLCVGGVVKLWVGLWWHVNSSAAALLSPSTFGFVSHEIPLCPVDVGDW